MRPPGAASTPRSAARPQGSTAPRAPAHLAGDRPALLLRPAPPSVRLEPLLSGSPTARLGFWAATLSASASLVFLVASVPVLMGTVAPPSDNVLTLVPSLLLATALLALLVCVDNTAPADKKVWSHLAVAFAGIYVALVSVVYVVELAVVEPLILRGDAARAGLLTIEPGGLLNAIDGLGYAFLGVALLFAAPVFAGIGLDRFIRWLLLANWCRGRANSAYLLRRSGVPRHRRARMGHRDSHLSVLLAIWFRRAGQSKRRAAAP
jgi:hypothetical protein